MWAIKWDKTIAEGETQFSPPQSQAPGERKAYVISHVIKAFCFDFQKAGREQRRGCRSSSFEVVYSLIRGNHEADLEQKFAQNKTSLGWVSSFYPSLPSQNNKGRCVAGSQPFLPCFRYIPPTATLLPAAGQGLKACFMYYNSNVENITSVLLEFFFFFFGWGKGDFFSFPSRFYCGMYQMVKG